MSASAFDLIFDLLLRARRVLRAFGQVGSGNKAPLGCCIQAIILLALVPMTPLAANEISKMEGSCQLAARTLAHVGSFVKEGMTTNELNQIADDFIRSHGAIPAPLNYHGFPKSICTSINECVCHGVPSEASLKEGDIINIDVTCILDGFFGDTSSMFFVGTVTERAKSLSECALQAMWEGIGALGPQATTGDVGFAVNKYVTRHGFYAVRDIGGHGIGKVFHDAPFVPSHGKKGRGPQLKPWCCLTVEPMVNEASEDVIELSIPNSTIKYYETRDKTLSAQYEHTIMITDSSYEVLTQL